MDNKKILYLEGRPNAHFLHRRFAQSVVDHIDFIDPEIQWQDKKKGFLFNIYAWLKNARYLASRYSEYDVILVDNLHFTPVIMKYLFSKKKVKLVVHLGSHTLYFILTRQFHNLNLLMHKFFLKKYDSIICEGEMAKTMVEEILKKDLPDTYVTFLGIPEERHSVLNAIQPDLQSYNILIIANGPSAFRSYYKGLDIMVKAFVQCLGHEPRLTLTILGDWDPDILYELDPDIDDAIAGRINFTGKVNNIEDYLKTTGLCLHCTRGDAFPTSTLETSAAGIPTLISEWTGTKEMIEKIDTRLIVRLDVELVSDKIRWYYNLPLKDRKMISEKSKAISKEYTEDKAITHYKNTFEKLLKYAPVI